MVLAWPAKLNLERCFPASNCTLALLDKEYGFVIMWELELDLAGQFDAMRVCETFAMTGASRGRQRAVRKCAIICLHDRLWFTVRRRPTDAMLISCARRA